MHFRLTGPASRQSRDSTAEAAQAPQGRIHAPASGRTGQACGASRCGEVHQPGIIADEYRAAGETGGDFGQAEGIRRDRSPRGNAASNGAAMARSASPGPAKTTGLASGSRSWARARNNAGEMGRRPSLGRPVRGWTKANEPLPWRQQGSGAGAILRPRSRLLAAAVDPHSARRQADRSCGPAGDASRRVVASAPSSRSSSRGCPPRGPSG